MKLRRWVSSSNSSGQALIEAAVTIPVLLSLVFNAINFGYFFLLLLNLNGAARSGVLYSIQGSDTPPGTALPAVSSTAKTVVNLIRGTGDTVDPGDLLSLASSSNTTVQVCSAAVGITGTTTRTTQCVHYTGATSVSTWPTPRTDPESTTFVANQVDVWYHFKPIIPGTAFNLIVLASPICSVSSGIVSCDFHQEVVMRAMGS